QIPQKFQAVDTSARPTATHHIHSSEVFWQSPQGLNMFVWGENDFLRAYRFNASTQKFNTPAQFVGSVLSPLTNAGMPGGFMAVSANASTSGSGILWATTPTSQDANHAVVAGSLRAFNAEGSGTSLPLLWDSTNLTGQDMGNLAKYNPPLVAQGRVYIPTFSNVVNVYGLQQAFNGATASIPGMIQAENFDWGGEGVAYHDSDVANNGGQYRPNESVDIEATTDTGGGFNVGWTAAGEWLEYTLNASAGNYTLTARIASMAAGSMSLSVDGVNIGTINYGNTGGWQTWTTATAAGSPSITAGQHVVRVTFNNASVNLNWINFAAAGGETPFGGTPWPIPGQIEAENFDNGGQGVAYNDTDAVNQGGQYRPSEGV
ncbi:MAG TPA: carbohydrate-binding domain-containing protein, partial [Chloroflexota bacterium]|nr:carbohydrate-binding domain-containing protein [Chloroflexota bacterium]